MSGVEPIGETVGMGPSDIPGLATTNGSVINVSEATFATDVVDRSRTTPVVLDLWASWCGPCRQLTPVLEKLAGEAAGAWVLAKIDVDANPRIAQALQVQGIPAVKAIVDGQIAGEFTGALPEPEVRRWLADVLAQAAPVAATDAPAPPNPQLDAALAAEQRGDLDAAESAYNEVLASAPAEAAAKTGLARIALQRRLTANDENALRTRAASGDPMAEVDLADYMLASGQIDEAFARIIDVVRRTSGDERDAVRQRVLSLFDLLPPDDPRLLNARRALASALF